MEDAAPAFDAAPPAEVDAEVEPVADENLWNLPAEPTAMTPEDAAPAFDAAPPAEVDAEVEPAADENPWNWPAEPAAMTPEDAAPAYDAAPPAEVEAEVEPVAEETGWDPEPFDAAVPVRPGFAVAAALGEPSLEEPVEEFSFLFEPESAEEERFAAPAVWVAPVSFVAPEPADEARPWWEPADEEEPPQVVAGLPKALEVPPLTIALPPTLTPTVDVDAWDEVPSIDSGVAAASVADSPPQPAQPVDDRWTVFVPEPNAADPVTSLTSVAEERTFTFDRRSATSERVNTDESPERAWASFGDEGHAGSLSAPLETALPESDVDDLATSLESQMAVADDERQARSRWDEAAAEFRTEDDESRRAVSARYQEDDDVVLRAFNAHAATPDPEPTPIDRNLQRAEDEAFDELLGAGAADIVAEAADEEEPARSFLNPRPSMALRRDMPENPFDAPWEQDEGEPRSYRSPVTDLRPASGTGSGADLPWGREFSFDDDSAAPAVSSHARHDRTKSVVREVVETVMLALLVFLCVRASFQNFKVDGSSMYPTLENGQFLIVNKLVYSEVDMEKLSNFIPLIDAGSGEKRNVFHGPERGDIVVLQDPRKPEVDLIKRVIGLPGETLEVIDGKVYINDFLLEEPYIKTVWHGTNAKQLVPPGQYFVMGDNRDNSLDSRSQQVGFVPKDLIIGKTLVSYWPKSKFGLAPNEAGNISTQDGVPKLTAQTVDEARLGR